MNPLRWHVLGKALDHEYRRTKQSQALWSRSLKRKWAQSFRDRHEESCEERQIQHSFRLQNRYFWFRLEMSS